MKPYYLLFSLLPLLFISCTPEENDVSGNCDHPSCSKYYHTWENIIKNRNDLSEYYFSNHIYPGNYNIRENGNGELFTIEYKVRIQWLVIELKDQFMVKIKDAEEVYPGQNVRRGQYFSENEIDAMISYHTFDSKMAEIDAIEKLGFASPTEAINVLRARAKDHEIYFKAYGYKSSTIGFRANGHPYLFCEGEMDPVSRTKLMGEIDLVSRDISTYTQTVQDKSSELLTY